MITKMINQWKIWADVRLFLHYYIILAVYAKYLQNTKPTI